MFGKQQEDIVNEVDVGNYIKELMDAGSRELNDYIVSEEEDDELVNDSRKPPTRTQDTE